MLGAKSYNDYMAEMYDDYAADSPESLIHAGIFINPYNNKSFNFINHIKLLFARSYNIRNILKLIYISNIKPNRESIEAITDNKQAFIKYMLEDIKHMGKVPDYFIDVMDKLRSWGIIWPEFDTIRKSYEGSKNITQ